MRAVLTDPRSGAVLDWELPIRDISLTRRLSAPSSVELTLPGEYHAIVFEGERAVLPWGSMLIVEDETAGTFTPLIVSEVSLADDLLVTGQGVGVLSQGVPWIGAAQDYSGYDAATAWWVVWAQILSSSRVRNLSAGGGFSTGVTAGYPGTAAYEQRAKELAGHQHFLETAVNQRVERLELQLLDQARAIARKGGWKTGVASVHVASDAPKGGEDGATSKAWLRTDTDGKVQAVYYWRWDAGQTGGRWAGYSQADHRSTAQRYVDLKAQRDAANDLYSSRKNRVSELEDWLAEHESEAGQSFIVSQAESTDLSEVLAGLELIGGIEWTEAARLQGEFFYSTIQGTTRAGRDRGDLVLELGANVHAYPELVRGNDIYSEVHVTGADALVATRSVSHDRLVRRVRSVSHPDLSTQQAVDAAANLEARAIGHLGFEFHRLTVTDSGLAPAGSVQLGDVIPLRGTMPDGSDLVQDVRVVEITTTGDEIEFEIGVV